MYSVCSKSVLHIHGSEFLLHHCLHVSIARIFLGPTGLPLSLPRGTASFLRGEFSFDLQNLALFSMKIWLLNELFIELSRWEEMSQCPRALTPRSPLTVFR